MIRPVALLLTALADIWRRCEADPAQRRARRAARADVERRLGLLDAVLDPATPS